MTAVCLPTSGKHSPPPSEQNIPKTTLHNVTYGSRWRSQSSGWPPDRENLELETRLEHDGVNTARRIHLQ
ncbi:hypothetical protein EYF80_034786 [Liparis tanakae]|uniref:Uncharacterized protein n=1 Tax=Liparis tanakae TaxID=230148 RepID=A0A4Z2GNS3_9TELE|nr:hypothetical protein EYF80_034786 [Liparis tanakae]